MLRTIAGYVFEVGSDRRIADFGNFTARQRQPVKRLVGDEQQRSRRVGNTLHLS